MDNKALDSQLKCERKELQNNECESIKALNKRINTENVLYTDFRTDEMYFAYQKFVTYGLDLKKLFDFQKTCPAVYPWNSEYASLRFGVNRRFNIFPLIIIMARTDKNVIDAFHFAKKYNIPLTLRGGSHSFEGFSLGDGMIIDQSKRNGIKINNHNNNKNNKSKNIKKTVTVEPGVLLGPLIEKLYEKKLAIPTGLCANNCIAGYSLGGGIGLLTRKYGVTSDSMLEVKVLLANGKVVIANEDENSDLYWACRGGGGNNFGIILSFKFEVYPMDKVYIIRIEYTNDKLREVIDVWQNVTPLLPNNLSLDLRAVAAKGMVSISGQYLGRDESILMSLLESFTNIENTKVYVERVKYVDAIKYFSGNGRWLPFFKMKTSFIEYYLTPDALDIFEHYMSIGSSSFNISMKSMGGKNNEINVDETAFPHRNVLGWFLIDAQWSEEQQEYQSVKWANDFFNDLSDYLPKKVYVNAPDIDLPNYLQQYYGDNLPRLIKIKQKYDPKNLFQYPQSIPTQL